MMRDDAAPGAGVPDADKRSKPQLMGGRMFRQLLTPVAGSLPLSFLVAALPVLTVLVLLGVVRRPAWQASLAGLIVGLLFSIIVRQRFEMRPQK